MEMQCRSKQQKENKKKPVPHQRVYHSVHSSLKVVEGYLTNIVKIALDSWKT